MTKLEEMTQGMSPEAVAALKGETEFTPEMLDELADDAGTMIDQLRADFSELRATCPTLDHDLIELVLMGTMYVFVQEQMQALIHRLQKAKGWWDNELVDTPTTKLLLVHSEISEAAEALRLGNPPDDKVPAFSGMEAELADAQIRMMDLCGHENLRLSRALVVKSIMNRSRGYRHNKLF